MPPALSRGRRELPSVNERSKEVETVLASLRPAMQADGGDVELVGLRGGVVAIRLSGTCLACPSIDLTLRLGIERTLRERLPWVTSVVRVREGEGREYAKSP